jgi:UDP-3-O-[3-hydroxymyristoyl] glucosamine N-acyltransferase
VSSNPGPVWVHPDARLDGTVRLEPFACVGPDAVIGPGTVIGAHAVVAGNCRIGARCRVGPGAVIGCAGFGYEPKDGRHCWLAHDGPVIIEDDVDIGANSTVACARTGRQTRIGAGTKIDALVHVGHNVTIGRNCIIIAQVGIAGSAALGDGVVLAGQTGISDHVRIGDGSIIYAKSALFRSVPAGARYSGIPARPHAAAKRFWARLWRRFGSETPDN